MNQKSTIISVKNITESNDNERVLDIPQISRRGPVDIKWLSVINRTFVAGGGIYLLRRFSRQILQPQPTEPFVYHSLSPLWSMNGPADSDQTYFRLRLVIDLSQECKMNGDESLTTCFIFSWIYKKETMLNKKCFNTYILTWGIGFCNV